MMSSKQVRKSSSPKGVSGASNGKNQKSKFIQAMDEEDRDAKTLQPGWNGTNAHNRSLLVDSYDDRKEKIEACLTDMFSSCTRGREDSFLESFKSAVHTLFIGTLGSLEIDKLYLAYVLAILAIARSSREGIGERLIFYKCISSLYECDRKLGKFLLSECLRTFGSYLDLKKLWWMLHSYGESIEVENSAFLQMKEDIVFFFTGAIKDNERKVKEWEKMSEEEKKTKKLSLNLSPKWVPKASHGIHFDRKLGEDLDREHRLNLLVASRVIDIASNGSLEMTDSQVAKAFRQIVSKQNRLIGTVETFMCGGDFEHLPYSTAPAGARKKYGKLSWKNQNSDGSQRSTKEDRVKGAEENAKCLARALKTGKGIKATNAGAISIVSEMYASGNPTVDTIQDWQARWNVTVRETREKIKERSDPSSFSFDKTVVVCDVSGSMTSGRGPVLPINASLMVGLMASELASGPWGNRVITFEEAPKWHNIPVGDTTKDDLWKRYQNLSKAPWGGTTNFAAVLDLILKVLKEGNLPQEDCPDSILIVSDMQVNQANRSGKTLVKDAQKRFADAGYKCPVLILWNVNASETTPATPYQEGVMCVSGYSENMLRMILDGSILSYQPPTPWETTKMALEAEWTKNIFIGAQCLESSDFIPCPWEDFWDSADPRWSPPKPPVRESPTYDALPPAPGEDHKSSVSLKDKVAEMLKGSDDLELVSSILEQVSLIEESKKEKTESTSV